MIAESTSRMVKQRSMEALDKLRTYTGNPDSRYVSTVVLKYYMYIENPDSRRYLLYTCTYWMYLRNPDSRYIV